MSSLYEIDKAYMEALNKATIIDEDTGEVFIDTDLLDALEGQYEAKIDNIVCFIKYLQGMNEMIKKEEAALYERRKANEKKVDNLKRYVSDSLNLHGLDKFETARNKLTFRTSKSVTVTNERLIDERYFITVLDKKLDKKMLLADLKNGAEIDGCELTIKSNLQVK